MFVFQAALKKETVIPAKRRPTQTDDPEITLFFEWIENLDPRHERLPFLL
jgi:hypothetical protein